MTDLQNNSQEIIPRKKPGKVSKYFPETWKEAQDLVENHPELTMTAIAVKFSMPVTTLESMASRSGWLNKRDLSKVRKADESLKKIVREVAYQINDLHGHVLAGIEAIQYSFRIKIIRDEDGTMHYINFEDFPDKPLDWEDLTEKEQKAYIKYIPPPRLKAFLEQLNYILQRQTSTLDFVAKMTKAALPKVDPDIINLTPRVAESNKFTDNTGMFKAAPKEDLEKDLDKLVNKIESKGEIDE